MERVTPSSIRFPRELRDRVRARARAERRTFSGMVLYLVEAALDGEHENGKGGIDADEIERLADLAREAVGSCR